MRSSVIAFLVAPSIAPVLVLVWALARHLDAGLSKFFVLIAAVLAYGGVCILGVPAYWFLKTRRQTSIWIAGLTGVFIGAATWLAFTVLLLLAREEGSKLVGVISDPEFLGELIWPSGSLGILVGLLFWCLARPDRQPA